MADCGGLPQVVQVSLSHPPHPNCHDLKTSKCIIDGYSHCFSRVKNLKIKLKLFFVCLFVFQPGKLAEAFKYFVQGMGYSEYLLNIL